MVAVRPRQHPPSRLRHPLALLAAFVLAASAACVALVAATPAAQAMPSLSARLARGEVQYGGAHRITGRLADGATALAGQTVILQALTYPYHGGSREVARTTTDAGGNFSLSHRFERNARMRVLAPAQGTGSVTMTAYVYPAFAVAFRPVRAGVVRLTQTYTVPRGTRLTQPTIFYLARARARTSSVRSSARVRRRGSTHFVSRRTVRLPAAWKGRFRYASCFLPSPGTGLGDPDATCPSRYRF